MTETMCSSYECPSRRTCILHNSSGTIPKDFQYWVNFDRRRDGELKCDYYQFRQPGGYGNG